MTVEQPSEVVLVLVIDGVNANNGDDANDRRFGFATAWSLAMIGKASTVGDDDSSSRNAAAAVVRSCIMKAAKHGGVLCSDL